MGGGGLPGASGTSSPGVPQVSLLCPGPVPGTWTTSLVLLAGTLCSTPSTLHSTPTTLCTTPSTLRSTPTTLCTTPALPCPQARKAFARYDVDDSGFLDVDEFINAVKDLGLGTNRDDALMMFSMADTDGNCRSGPCVVPPVPCRVPPVPCVVPLVRCVEPVVRCAVPQVPYVVPLVPGVVP